MLGKQGLNADADEDDAADDRSLVAEHAPDTLLDEERHDAAEERGQSDDARRHTDVDRQHCKAHADR